MPAQRTTAPGGRKLVAMATVTEENRKDLAQQLYQKALEVRQNTKPSDEDQNKYGMFLEAARRPEGLTDFEKMMVDRWRAAKMSDEVIKDILEIW